jgi:hypothetical protein
LPSQLLVLDGGHLPAVRTRLLGLVLVVVRLLMPVGVTSWR